MNNARMRWLAVVALFTIITVPGSTAQSRPNVVLILADDLGYGDVGAFNTAGRIPTPHLDPLARDRTPLGCGVPIRKRIARDSGRTLEALSRARVGRPQRPGAGFRRGKGLPPVQLFDLDADPAENTNLQAAHPDIVLRLKALLGGYRKTGRSR